MEQFCIVWSLHDLMYSASTLAFTFLFILLSFFSSILCAIRAPVISIMFSLESTFTHLVRVIAPHNSIFCSILTSNSSSTISFPSLFFFPYYFFVEDHHLLLSTISKGCALYPCPRWAAPLPSSVAAGRELTEQSLSQLNPKYSIYYCLLSLLAIISQKYIYCPRYIPVVFSLDWTCVIFLNPPTLSLTPFSLDHILVRAG